MVNGNGNTEGNNRTLITSKESPIITPTSSGNKQAVTLTYALTSYQRGVEYDIIQANLSLISNNSQCVRMKSTFLMDVSDAQLLRVGLFS